MGVLCLQRGGITIGLILFGIKVRQGQMFDIEFAGGTSVQFDLQASDGQGRAERSLAELRL